MYFFKITKKYNYHRNNAGQLTTKNSTHIIKKLLRVLTNVLRDVSRLMRSTSIGISFPMARSRKISSWSIPEKTLKSKRTSSGLQQKDSAL